MKKKKKQVQAGTTRRVFRYFRYTECDAFGQYLHEMSLDGWHFQKWQMGLVFEKGEPADITYCVEVFPKGSEMDLKPEEQAEEYADYCSVAGWELIDGQRKFCIFRRRDPDAMPIVTEEERFENVRKAERRELLWDMLVPVLLTAPPPMAPGAWVAEERLLRESARLAGRYRELAERANLSASKLLFTKANRLLTGLGSIHGSG